MTTCTEINCLTIESRATCVGAPPTTLRPQKEIPWTVLMTTYEAASLPSPCSVRLPTNPTCVSQTQFLSAATEETRKHIYSSKTNQMQRYAMVFITINALRVSGSSSIHHQELKTAYTAIVSEVELVCVCRSRKSSTNT